MLPLLAARKILTLALRSASARYAQKKPKRKIRTSFIQKFSLVPRRLPDFMKWCTLVAGGMVHSVMLETLGELEKVPELMRDRDEYVVKSSVSNAHFIQFLGYTIGDKIEITVENFNDMKSLASEFGFARLQAKIDDFRAFRDDSPDYEGLQKRYEKLDQRLQEGKTAVKSLKVQMQMWMDAIRDRLMNYEAQRVEFESNAESLEVMVQKELDAMEDHKAAYEANIERISSEVESLKDEIQEARAKWTESGIEELPAALDEIRGIVKKWKVNEHKIAQIGSILDECLEYNEELNRRTEGTEEESLSPEEEKSRVGNRVRLMEATSAWACALARFEPLIQSNEDLKTAAAGAQLRIRVLEEERARVAGSLRRVEKKLAEAKSAWSNWRASIEPLVQAGEQELVQYRTNALTNAVSKIAQLEARMTQLSEAVETIQEQHASVKIVEAPCTENGKKLDALSEPMSEMHPEQMSEVMPEQTGEVIPAPPPGSRLVWVSSLAQRWRQRIKVTGSRPSGKKHGWNNVLYQSRDNSYYQSLGRSLEEWLQCDLEPVVSNLESYTLWEYQLTTCHSPAGKKHLKSWELRVSADGDKWTVVDRRTNEPCLNNARAKAIFHPAVNVTQPFRYIRLVITGPNHSGSLSLVCAHIDFCLSLPGG